jgi:hypothetical protein
VWIRGPRIQERHLKHSEINLLGGVADGAGRSLLSLHPVTPVLNARLETLEAALALLRRPELRLPAPMLRSLGVRARRKARCGCGRPRTIVVAKRREDH